MGKIWLTISLIIRTKYNIYPYCQSLEIAGISLVGINILLTHSVLLKNLSEFYTFAGLFRATFDVLICFFNVNIHISA